MKKKLWMSRDGWGDVSLSLKEPMMDVGEGHLDYLSYDPMWHRTFRRAFRGFLGLRKGQKKQVIVTIEDV